MIAAALLILAGAALGQGGDAEAGRKIYEAKCSQCHGARGDGKGPAADLMLPRPRDFTSGKYKIRTTESGSVPTDRDLFRIITEGMPGTAMPSWAALSEKQRWDLVAYLKTFSENFKGQEPQALKIPDPPRATPQRLELGRKVYLEELKCNACHGDSGRGNGPSAPTLRDDGGNPIWPADLTKPWNFRGGSSASDIYRTLLTGLDGTPMPSFKYALNEEELEEKLWALVQYVKSLSGGKEKPAIRPALRAAYRQNLPQRWEDPAWEEAEEADFPLAGQVVTGRRNFTASVDLVSAKALYSDAEVALRISWNDRTASKAGRQQDPRTGKMRRIFPDQIAVQIAPAGADKPYFLGGSRDRPVGWRGWTNGEGFWTARAEGIRNVRRTSLLPAGEGGFSAEYSDGQWRVLLRWSRSPAQEAPNLFPEMRPGAFYPVSFFVWDGDNGETAEICSLSSWYDLVLVPPLPAAVYVWPAAGFLLAAGLETVLWRRLRRRRDSDKIPAE